jgi:flagella basal body P-ring formation protein FlgA
MRGRNYLLALLLAAVLPASGAATDANAVRQAVTTFMQGYAAELGGRGDGSDRVEFAINALDPRLTLPDCAVPLAVTALPQPRLQPRLNTQVSCASGNGWSLYVPVELAVYRPVLVASRPLGRGESLGPGDLNLVSLDVTRIHGEYLTQVDAALGLELRRPLAQESPLLADDLLQPLLIRRGEAVNVSAAGSAVAVSMPGIALTDGRRGEQIRVRNQSSSRVVQGRVVAPGRVEITLLVKQD